MVCPSRKAVIRATFGEGTECFPDSRQGLQDLASRITVPVHLSVDVGFKGWRLAAEQGHLIGPPR